MLALARYKLALAAILPVASLLLTSNMLCAKTKKVNRRAAIQITDNRRPTTIGFQAGPTHNFTAANKHMLKNNGKAYTFQVRKPLLPNVKIEAGIRYSSANTTTATTGLSDVRVSHIVTNTTSVTIPVNLQYYFLPAHYKLQPFCGAGVQCDLAVAKSPFTSFSPTISKTNDLIRNTRYVSLLLTQGLTFQINTKIQLSESVHFVQNESTSSLGMEFGIGYKIH